MSDATDPDPDAPVALVTGASSGIGREVAAQLHAKGYTVYGTSRHPDALADRKVPGVRYLELDLADDESIVACAAAAGPVDLLVNNAGESMLGPIEDVPVSAVERLFRVNVVGQIALTKAVLPGMRERGGGTIVMVGSMLGSLPIPFRSTYAAAKAALRGFSDAARRELAPFGIAVFTFEPGTIATGIGDRRSYHIAKDSPYEQEYRTVAAATARNEDRGMAVEPLARALVAAALSRNPKPHYAKGNSARFVFALKRLLPAQSILDITARFHGLRRVRSPSDGDE